MLKDSPFALLQFYATAPYSCSYLPEQLARSQVATPSNMVDTVVYSDLVRAGFRRSGIFTYRPYCDACHACIPVRIPVETFSPSRIQRRTFARNAELIPCEKPLVFSEEHYALYQRYQSHRHAGGGMDNDSREQYAHFLLQSQVETRLMEFRQNGELRIVCLIDILTDGISSVYTFFDPELAKQSLGTFSILWQIELTRSLKLPYLYLGYWIRDSQKMAYKAQFNPLEARLFGNWQTMDDALLSLAFQTTPSQFD